MPVYVIADIRLHEGADYSGYVAAVPPLVARHGGEYLARGGACTVIEGTWTPSRLVLFRYPSLAAFQALLDDPDYAPWKAFRHSVSDSSVVAVEGVG